MFNFSLEIGSDNEISCDCGGLKCGNIHNYAEEKRQLINVLDHMLSTSKLCQIIKEKKRQLNEINNMKYPHII